MNRVQIFKGEGKLRRYYWRVVAANGRKTAQSEGYVTKWNARRAAHKLYPELEILDLTEK